jgi:alpha-1,3-rhamnosyl/mannosyltransferase
VPLFLPGRAARGLRGPVKKLPGAYLLAELLRAERLRRAHVTVYHETNHAAPRFDGPVVLTVHDLSTVLYPHLQESARSRHFARALLGRARKARRVIVPTEAVAREVVAHLSVPPGNVRVIPHGPTFDSLGLQRERYVLYVGALDPRKGLLTLLDALPEGVELVLAGPLDRAPGAVRARIGGRVRATGYVDDAQLSDLYARAAVLVLPSLYEGFGLPLLEGMATGTPCVASDDPALVEVSGGAALHFPRGDAGALRLLLLRVLEDEALRRDLSARGLERARAFSWERCAREHLEAYREAVA